MKAFYTFLLAIMLMSPIAGIPSAHAADAKQAGPVKGADIKVVADKGVLAVAVKTSSADPFQSGWSFNEDKSYAVNDTGKRFNLYIRPNPAGRNAKTGYTSEVVTLKDDCEKELKWKPGNWKLVLAMNSPAGVVMNRASFELK